MCCGYHAVRWQTVGLHGVKRTTVGAGLPCWHQGERRLAAVGRAPALACSSTRQACQRQRHSAALLIVRKDQNNAWQHTCDVQLTSMVPPVHAACPLSGPPYSRLSIDRQLAMLWLRQPRTGSTTVTGGSLGRPACREAAMQQAKSAGGERLRQGSRGRRRWQRRKATHLLLGGQ